MLPKKTFINDIKLRHKAFGNERRRNITKVIMENKPNFPLGVTYEDIDKSFQEFVENKLYIVYDGKKVPTFKLFSNQRVNEYAQTWEHLDETGNLIMNFKTITRDNNPKKGENQGSNYNIPGNRDYPMFMIPILQENGIEAYDMYSMKQPFTVDIDYTVTLIANKYELINKMNEIVNYEFKSINSYISPNGHYMPMVLSDISDESEYSMDDRKYYSQSYKIRVKAYIIREEDFKVTHVPSRVIVNINGTSDKIKKPKVKIQEEDYIADECCLREEEEPYYNKLLTLIIKFPYCKKKTEFIIDTDMIIRQFETENVYDFVMSVNNEFQSLDKDITVYNGDKLMFEIESDEMTEDSVITIKGFDPNVILDGIYDPESALDENINEEEIIHLV